MSTNPTPRSKLDEDCLEDVTARHGHSDCDVERHPWRTEVRLLQPYDVTHKLFSTSAAALSLCIGRRWEPWDEREVGCSYRRWTIGLGTRFLCKLMADQCLCSSVQCIMMQSGSVAALFSGTLLHVKNQIPRCGRANWNMLGGQIVDVVAVRNP